MRDDPDPLDGLEAIDWTGLTHAYGSAANVPGLLLDVASGSSDERRRAIWELSGNIHHQGTVYAASAPAVPFLARLARSGSIPPDDRAQLISLVAAIASGTSYLEVHEPLIPDGLTEAQRTSIGEERSWARQAHEAAAAAAPSLLADLDPATSATTWPLVGLAAQVPEAASDAHSVLQQLRAATLNPLRRTAIELTLALIGGTVNVDDLRRASMVRQDLADLADPALWESPAHGAKYLVTVLLEESAESA